MKLKDNLFYEVFVVDICATIESVKDIQEKEES